MKSALEQLRERVQLMRMEKDLNLVSLNEGNILSENKTVKPSNSSKEDELIVEHKKLQRLAGITSVSFEDVLD